MAAVVSATPTSQAVNQYVTVTMTGGADDKNRLKLDGTVEWTGCHATSDTAQIQLGSVATTSTIAWEQYIAGTWTSVATCSETVTAATGSALTYTARPAIPALPTYLVSQADPTWGTNLIRISNSPSRRHFYARYCAWNSDSTKLLMNFTYPGRMIDGTTYADIGSFATLSNAVWCNTDNNKLYGVDGGGSNILYTQNATTAALTTKHTFAAGYTVWIGGDSASWEGGISDDDKYLCLTLTDVSHGGGDRLITYDTVGDSIVGNIAKPASMDNAQISRLGTYVVVVAGGTTRRYTRDLTSSILLVAHGNHGDNALDLFGNEIFVTNNAPGVVSYLLSSGASRMLLSPGSAFEYGHTSGRGPAGWVYLSVYDTITTAGRLGFDQVVGLKTDGSGEVVVFGFANHNNNGSIYATQPHATPSRDGQRIVVASEWGATDVYDYVFSL